MESRCNCSDHFSSNGSSRGSSNSRSAKLMLSLALYSKSSDHRIVQAVRQGNIDFLKQLILEIGTEEFRCKVKKLSLIFEAICNDMFCLVDLFIDTGVDINDICELRGYSPLHLACLVNDLDWIKVLFTAGALVDIKDISDMTPLQYLINTETIRRKYGIVMPNQLLSENEVLIKLFLQNGANLEVKNKDGETPLYESVLQRNYSLVKLLLECKADPNVKNKYGETLLYQAIVCGRCEIIKLLLDYGVDLKQRNHDGETLLLNPALKGNCEVVKLLLDYGFDVNDRCLQGNTLLHILQDHEMFSHPSSAFLMKKVRNLLIDKGIDVNNRNNSGVTALHKAAESCRYKFSKMLLEYGADVDARTNQGITPLHMAVCQSQNSQLVELLIKNHADINAKDEKGITPLHYLLLRSRPDPSSVNLLLSNGADIYSETNRGSFPFKLIRSTSNYVLKARGLNKQLLVSKMLTCALKLAATNLPQYSSEHYSKLLLAIDFDEKLKKAFDEFSNEILFLKKNTVDHITFYNILIADDQLMLRYLQNEIIEESLFCEKYLELFPLFGNCIQAKYLKAKKRKCLLDSGTSFFNFLSANFDYPLLPLECIELIVSGLSNHQLTNLHRIINHSLP